MTLQAYGLIAAIIFGLALGLSAETVKDREGAVRGDRAKMADNQQWLYNDVDAAFAAAKQEGKPLMVVLRCVPCLACMGLDTEVLTSNPKLQPLMQQFVRARVINANNLDLSRFQFDYDLSFTVMFFNGDGTLYGRYGSWEHQKDPQNRATETFRQALQGALALHQGYPRNKAALAGKQGKPIRYKKPTDMPTIKGKYKDSLDWNGKVVKSCVHCHQIGDALRSTARRDMPQNLIYPFPQPSAIGLTLGGKTPLTIAAVAPDTPAAVTRLRPGDRLVSINGQALISTADFSWALHHVPDAGGRIPAVIARDGKSLNGSLLLPAGWRTAADISRRVGTWPMRADAFGGIRFDDLPDDERRKFGLQSDQLGLLAKHVGRYGRHAAAKRLGWQPNDVLVVFDGSTERMTESKLLGSIMTTRRPGDKIPVTVLRKGKRQELKLPVQ